MQNATDGLTILLIALVILAALFLIFRQFVLWYFRINERTELLKDIRDSLRQTQLIGTPTMIRQRLAEYEEAGIQEIVVRFVDATGLESIRLFARECMGVG